MNDELCQQVRLMGHGDDEDDNITPIRNQWFSTETPKPDNVIIFIIQTDKVPTRYKQYYFENT